MRQSCPPCHPVRGANLSCRYESFITTVVILPIPCLCERCDGKVPRRTCWLPPDYSVAVLAKRLNHRGHETRQVKRKLEMQPSFSSSLARPRGETALSQTIEKPVLKVSKQPTKASIQASRAVFLNLEVTSSASQQKRFVNRPGQFVASQQRNG